MLSVSTVFFCLPFKEMWASNLALPITDRLSCQYGLLLHRTLQLVFRSPSLASATAATLDALQRSDEHAKNIIAEERIFRWRLMCIHICSTCDSSTGTQTCAEPGTDPWTHTPEKTPSTVFNRQVPREHPQNRPQILAIAVAPLVKKWRLDHSFVFPRPGLWLGG